MLSFKISVLLWSLEDFVPTKGISENQIFYKQFSTCLQKLEL